MSRLESELRRVFGDPPEAPRAVVRLDVTTGQGWPAAAEEADRLVDAGVELVVLDAPGAGVAALAALAVLLDLEPVAVVGTDQAQGWRETVLGVRNAVRSAKPLVAEPVALLERLGDPALTRTTALLARLSDRRTPVLCGGGTTTAAAALVAGRVSDPDRWLAGSVPALGAAAQAWRSLGLEPLLDLGLTRGSSDVAVAVVRTGLELLGA